MVRIKKHFLCCILKGVNRYDSKSHFVSKKIQSCHRMLCKKTSNFTGCGIGFFYYSEVYLLMRNGVSDMHCMSDDYLAEELQQEYAEKCI